MKMAMRQMTWFSMVSSNWDDSFGSQHLPSAIYALAETARGEVVLCSNPRRSKFTARRSVNVAVNGLEPTQDGATLTFFMSAFAERPASASPDGLPALGATARGRAAARWLLDEASESE